MVSPVEDAKRINLHQSTVTCCDSETHETHKDQLSLRYGSSLSMQMIFYTRKESLVHILPRLSITVYASMQGIGQVFLSCKTAQDIFVHALRQSQFVIILDGRICMFHHQSIDEIDIPSAVFTPSHFERHDQGVRMVSARSDHIYTWIALTEERKRDAVSGAETLKF